MHITKKGVRISFFALCNVTQFPHFYYLTKLFLNLSIKVLLISEKTIQQLTACQDTRQNINLVNWYKTFQNGKWIILSNTFFPNKKTL